MIESSKPLSALSSQQKLNHTRLKTDKFAEMETLISGKDSFSKTDNDSIDIAEKQAGLKKVRTRIGSRNKHVGRALNSDEKEFSFACHTGRLVQNDTKLKSPRSKSRGLFLLLYVIN